MFGFRAVREEKNVDLVIWFVQWKEGMEEDRTGLEVREADILGCRVPLVQLAVRPGRDMARLVEVAVMVYALRKSGHDPARDFDERLLRAMNPTKEK